VTAEARPRVLVVDDDDTYRAALTRAFERRGFDVLAASSVAQALPLCEASGPNYASIDLRMPGASGLELVRQLAALHPSTVIVVLTGYGSIATAVEAVKLGASNYLTKPADVQDLLRAFGVTSSPSSPSSPPPDAAGEVPSLARVEWEHISRVVADCGGNISKAARLLRLQRRSLQRKLAKYPVSR
jgi:two-component system, response regulator RegA